MLAPQKNIADSCFYNAFICKGTSFVSRAEGDAYFTLEVPKGLAKETRLSSEPLPENGQDLTLFFLLFFAIFTFVYAANKSKIKQLFWAFFGNRFSSQLIREGQLLRGELFYFSLVFGSAVLSSMVLVFKNIGLWSLGWSDPAWFVLLVWWLALVLIILIKTAISYGVLAFFGALKEADEYVFNFFNYCLFIGFTIFPLLLVGHFANSAIASYIPYVVALVILLYWAMFIFKLFTLGFNNYNHRLRHIILYLCSLEILPLLIIGKALIK